MNTSAFLSRSGSFLGTTTRAISILASLSVASPFARAADFDWNQTDTPNDWSLNTNWTPTAAVGGPDAPAAFVLINTNIASTSTINLFTTGNPGDLTKTIGRLDIGDTNATNGYTIATGTGAGILNFDGNGSNAQLNQLSTSGNNSITAPITLTSSLDISNAAASNTLTLSTGGITSATAGTKTITSTTGAVTMSGIIGNGSGTVALVQDGAGTLTLSGSNTFTGGLTIKNGTVIAGANAQALGGAGTGAVTIGGGVSSGAADATLLGGASSSITFANPITVASGGTGLYTIGNSGGAVTLISGGITLNNDLTIAESNTPATGVSVSNYMVISGGISGSGDLTLAANGGVSTGNDGGLSVRNAMTISAPISTTGTITNAGTGKPNVVITGVISNANSLIQDSATSRLTLSGSNTYTGPTNVNAGVLRITNNTAISTSSAVTVAAGATLQVNGATSPNTAQTLTLSGHGSEYSTGALEVVSSGGYLGNVVLAADTTFSGSFAANTLTVGTVGVTTITGSGRNLITTGAGSVTLSGSLNTGAGTLTKLGTGVLTLSGSNSFTGLTSINRGTLSVNISSALSGGGNITFGGGAIRHNATNLVNYGSRIVGSTGPISIDTFGQSVTYSGIASGNTGGLAKIGTGTLTLSGTNSYTGITAVNGGNLVVSATSALPGSVYTDVTGTLNQGGAYTGVQGWLASGKVDTTSVGAIAITGNSSENIDFNTGGFSNLMLGATTASTYTGTLTAASGTYHLGGGNAVITLSNTNALNSANALVVGARTGNGSAAGGLTLSAANNMTGTTTQASGSLTLNSATAGLATSDVTVNRGLTLTVNYAAGNLGADNNVTRAKSLQLNGATLNVSGNTGGNSTETITNALTFGQGQSSVIIAPAAGKHALVSAGSFVRNAGATVLFAGTSLGVNANAATNVSSANVSFGGGGPTLNGVGTAGGAGGTTLVGILAGAYGDTTSGGNGLGATGGLVTYDATNGIRLLSGSEYKTTLTGGETTLDNIRLSSTGGATVTTTLNSDTIINSLSILTSTAGSSVAVAGSGKLTLNTGVIHANATTGTANGVSNAIDFNGNEAIILSTSASGENLNLSGVLSNTGGNGLTKSGSGTLRLSGTAANTYTGTTTVNGGILSLGKTAGVNAVNGDLVINTGAQVTLINNNQIADSSNVTVNGGTFTLAPSSSNNGATSETINNLTMINGATVGYGQRGSGPTFTVNGTATVSGGSTLFQNDGGQLLIAGLTSLSDGGTLTVKGAQSTTSTYDGIVTLTGGLSITNTATGAYTPVTISYGEGSFRNGGLLNLGGDLTFTGNTTNLNTTTIDAITGYGARGVMALDGVRTFTVGNGAATADLTVAATMVDGTSTGGLIKAGAGTLALTSSNAYTGATTVAAGRLMATVANSLAGTTSIAVTGGAAASAELAVGSAADMTGKIVNITTVNGGVYRKDFLAAASFATYGSAKSSFAGGNPDTTASFLAGVASTDTSLLTSFSNAAAIAPSNDAQRISDVFSLTKATPDVFVLQLNVTGVTADSYLAWNNGSTWVNAIAGNTGANGGLSIQGYSGSFASFGGAATSAYLGSWGYDTSNANVWAVLDHNSEYAVINVVPEPNAFALITGAFAMLFGFQRSRKRR